MAIEEIAFRISDRLVDKEVIADAQRDRVAYGFSLFLSAFIITITIFTLGTATGMIVPCIVYSVWFWTTRNIVGLYHCNTYFKCFTLSVSLYSIFTVCYLIASSDNTPIAWLLLGVCLLVHKAIEIHEIPDKKRKKGVFSRYRKLLLISSVGVVLSILFTALKIRYLSFPISYGIFVTSLLFAPSQQLNMEEKT